MRIIKYNFLFIFGLILMLGITTVVNGQYSQKRPKNSGILTVKTSPVAYSVKVNDRFLGMSGVDTPAEFFLPPGVHRLVVEFPNGKFFSKDVEIRRDAKNCVCLRYVEETLTRPCPYDIRVDGPDRVIEGDLITFAAFNAVTDSPTPINYRWRVSPNVARITSGVGTSAITVDTTGIGGQTVQAELDVWDDVYGDKCRQNIDVPTIVERLPPPPQAYKCDTFESVTPDDDKARFDNCVIELQNKPDSQIYIILYQGTDRDSRRLRDVEKLSQRTLDYLVKSRGVDPRRVLITRGGTRLRTTYEIWIVPPGATPPVPTS